MAGESQQLPTSESDLAAITEIIDKEIKHVRELMEAKIKATDDSCDQKFEAVEERLNSGEAARKEQKTDTKTAVDAALTAQKDAVREQTAASEKAIAKSEQATAKEISQMSATFGAGLVGVTNSVSDVKDRTTKVESDLRAILERSAGSVEERTEHRAGISASQATIGFIVMLVLAAIPYLILLADSSSKP